MSDYRIITNHVPRDIIPGTDLTKTEQADFDYIDWDDEDVASQQSFARYKGELIHLDDMERGPGEPQPFKGWDNYRTDSFFSGLVIKYVHWTNEPMQIIVGRYLS